MLILWTGQGELVSPTSPELLHLSTKQAQLADTKQIWIWLTMYGWLSSDNPMHDAWVPQKRGRRCVYVWYASVVRTWIHTHTWWKETGFQSLCSMFLERFPLGTGKGEMLVAIWNVITGENYWREFSTYETSWWQKESISKRVYANTTLAP